MLDRGTLLRLQQIVGRGHVGAKPQDIEVYSYDASLAVAAPAAVVFPADTHETAAVVRLAREAGVSCVPRGFGTNLSGGSVADGGLVIGLTRLNRILTLSPEGRYAVVQPGVTNLELQNALAPLGFYYAPDPASQKVATLGGNVGENAGGPHCLKYGVTTNHILGMTVVLPGGEIVRVGGPALDPPGYDLRGVLVGSEGTLGIVTEVVVRILPLPESVLTLLAVYDGLADAARSVSAIIAAGIVPATLEMIDAMVIQAIEDSKPCGYPRDAAAVLIAEVDGPAVGLADQAERISQLCLANGCREVRRAKDAAERELLWAGRRGAFGAIARLAPNFLVADCTVPRTRLPDALAQVGAIAAKHRLRHGNVFHAGDGNLHPLLLFDSRDAELVQRVHHAGREIMEACVALGGTITGEHGVGREKADAMRLVFSEDDLKFQRRLRSAFDPCGLLNPGKIFPSPDTGMGHVSNVPRTMKSCATSGELAPASVDEACDILGNAYLNGAAVVPCGSRTRLDWGNSSDRPAVLLRSTGLAGVREYDPANQVISVGAGMSLASLQEILAQHGQWLPLRPPLARRRTVGGIVASGSCGPERLRYGAPRDLLLGLKFISGDGRLISAGGRVVKNVAGYDVTRLLAGSAGTLGFLTELTFRVLSLPQCCMALTSTGTLTQCGAAAAGLLRSKLEPCFVVAVPDALAPVGNALRGVPGIAVEASMAIPGTPRRAFPTEGWPQMMGDRLARWNLIVGFEGFPNTVESQADGCRTLLNQAGLCEQSSTGYRPSEGVLGGYFETLYRETFLLRADVPLDRVAGFLADHRELMREANLLVDFGCGRISASMTELTDNAWAQWREAVLAADGSVILEKASESFRRQHDLLGPARPDWPLARKIKEALDPGHVFAPTVGWVSDPTGSGSDPTGSGSDPTRSAQESQPTKGRSAQESHPR